MISLCHFFIYTLIFSAFAGVLCLPGNCYARYVVVSGDYNYPPYEFIDNGIPTGFNIDVIRAVARSQNMEIKINLKPWRSVLSDFDSGRCDVLSGMFFSEERAAKYLFSNPHNIVSHSIFVRDDSDIESLDDLADKEIIVQYEDIMHEYVRTKIPGAKIISTTSQEDALHLLAEGMHDAALLGKLQILFRISRENLKNVKSVGPGFAFGEYCFAVKKGDEKLLSQLNEGLKLIKSSGEYNRIYRKWFGVYERQSFYDELIYYGMFFVIPLLLSLTIFIGWNWMLRRKVRHKTQELTDELAERRKTELELKKVESYLTNVINSMPSMLIGVDTECLITQLNFEAEQELGVSRSEVVGRSFEQALPALSGELSRIKEALQTGEIIFVPKLTRYGNSGTRYEDVTVYPLVVDDVVGAVLRIDDMTERMNLEQMIMQSEKMVSIGGLAAGMAHEINNPLAAVVGHAQNIKRRIGSDIAVNYTVAEECGVSFEKVQDYLRHRGILRMLDNIIESGNRAAKIVINMLSFSRRSDQLFARHNIAEILDRTLELASSDYNLKKQYDFKQIEIVREYDVGIADVSCEENEIQQVFLNLFRNAAEAMNEKVYSSGGPRFTLRVRKAGRMVRVEIEDNGPGMDVEVRKRIFEPFYTTKNVGKGTGLGLSVSYFIVTEHHGGALEVESMPGEWTRFIVKLPIDG